MDINETITEEHIPEPVSDTLTEEPIVEQHNEDLANQQVSEKPEDKPEDKAEDKSEAVKPPEEPKKPRPGIKAMPDDTYIVTDADGKQITLTEDQVKGLAEKRVGKYVYRAGEVERENQRLRAALEAAQKAPEPIAPPDDDKEPDFETGDYESLAAYNRDWYSWRQRQDAREAKPATDTVAQPDPGFADWHQKSASILQEGAKRFSDFEEVVTRSDGAFTYDATNFIYSMADDSAAVLYELGQHPDELLAIHQNVASGNLAAAARALGRVEARIEARTKPDVESDPDDSRPRITRAPTTPPPISPISSRSGSVAPRKGAEQMTQKEYEIWRQQGGGK